MTNRDNMGDSSRVELPPVLTSHYLDEHRTDVDMAEYVRENYLEMLSNVNADEKPDMCISMAMTLGYYADGFGNDTYRIPLDRAQMEITRIGINSLYIANEGDGLAFRPGTKNEGKVKADVAYKMGELYLLYAYSLDRCNRPLESMAFLDYAEKQFLRLLSVLRAAGVDEKDLFIAKEKYEECRAKEADNWYRMFDYLNESIQLPMMFCIDSYYRHSIDEFMKMGSEENADFYYRKLCEFSLHYLNNYGKIDPSAISGIEYKETDYDKYEEWCWNNHLYLNIMDEVPNYNPDWVKDDLVFDLSESGNLLVRDIISTFDHCRRLMHRYTRIPEEIRFAKERDEDVESLLDCYFRLYSILDKTAKIINELYPQSSELNGQITFKEVVSNLWSNSNQFLRGIYQINRDLFPQRDDYKKMTIAPFLKIVGTSLWFSTIRNDLTHSAIEIVPPNVELNIVKGTTHICARDLEFYIVRMTCLVREVLLNLQLAVNYDKRQKKKP